MIFLAGSEAEGTREVVQGLSASNDQIILALIALIATSIGALVWVIRNGKYAKEGAEQARAANRAVNNIGPGEHSIFTMVEHIRDDVKGLKRQQEEFESHGWGTLPADIGTAVGLTTTIRDLQRHTEEVGCKLDTIIDELREHVVWEMDAKYGKHGGGGGY